MHIIELETATEEEATAFIKSLAELADITPIGTRTCDGAEHPTVKVIAINWIEDASSETDQRIEQFVSATGGETDEISAYLQMFPGTRFYRQND